MENQKYIIVVGSAREKAYKSIRSRIINLDLTPGASISIQDMASELEISRTPVREAFIRLHAENLLEVSPQRPSIVTRIDLDLVKQECFVREALEVENMRYFVPNHHKETIDKMRANIEKQREALNEKKYDIFQELDNAFHLLAFSDTDQQLAANQLALMNGNYDRTRMLIRRSEEVSNDIIGEHMHLVDSIVGRHKEKTIEELRNHIQKYNSIVYKIVEKWPDYFVQSPQNMMENTI